MQNEVTYEVEGINVDAEVDSQCSPRGCKIPPGEYIYENSAKTGCTLPEVRKISQEEYIQDDVHLEFRSGLSIRSKHLEILIYQIYRIFLAYINGY